MRRLVSVALLLAMIICFAGCAKFDEKKIEEKMQGTWTVEGELYGSTYTFKDGTYEKYIIRAFQKEGTTTTGEYTIKEDGIYFDGKDTPSITFTYDKKSGELKMRDTSKNELEKFSLVD